MSQPDEFEIIDDTEDDHVAAIDAAMEAELADRLDRNRIQQLSKLRRATDRSRSYAIIATIASTVGAIHAGTVAFDRYRAGGFNVWTLSAIGLLILLVVISTFTLQRAMALHRELSSRSLNQPATRNNERR